MKKVFRSNRECTHVWAQRTHPEGRTPTGSVFFEGDAIYSYGKHYCMARFVETAQGETAVLMNDERYSLTTSVQMTDVRRALPSGTKIFYVVNPESAPVMNREFERAQKKVTSSINTAKRARKYSVMHLETARREAETFNKLAEAFCDTRCIVLDAAFMAALDAENEAKKMQDAKESKEREAAHAQALIDNAALIRDWKNNSVASFNWEGAYPLNVYLRVKGDEVETSRGAFVPVEHAKKLWPYIQKAQATGIAPEILNKRIGLYTLNEIKASGDVVIGCHDIKFSEIHSIAVQLGLAS
jgi:hypothetical protein